MPASGSDTLSITGTPAATGTETFTVTATDTLGATTSTDYSITVNPAVALGPASLPADTVNVAYNQTITASGGTGTDTLAVTDIQNPIAGLIVPAGGSNSLTYHGHAHGHRDGDLHGHGHRHAGGHDLGELQRHGQWGRHARSLDLPADTVNVAYSQTLTASGGTGPDTLTVTNIQNAVADLIVPSGGSNSLTYHGHAHDNRD